MTPPRMDHRTFVSLTGEDLIKRFKRFDDLLVKEGITEEFLTLYKIWSYFQKPDSLPDDKKDDLDMRGVPRSFDNQVLNATEAESKLDPSGNQPATAPEIKINLDAELNPSENQLSKAPKIIVLQNVAIKPGKDTIHSLPSTSKNISDYLVVPETPTRKNKRNIERVSFAITSREYQESFEKKRALKLELENKKLERKRKREESAAAKALKKTVRDNDKNNSCFVCKVRTIKNNYLTCNGCKKRIHRRCVPKIYDEHVPEESDEDLFMCHMCYTEESDDDDVISEIDSEEDSEMYNEKEFYRSICKESNEDNPDQELKEIGNKRDNEINAQEKNDNLCDEPKQVDSSEGNEIDVQDETNSKVYENPGAIESEEGIEIDDKIKTDSKTCKKPKMGSEEDLENYDDMDVEDLFNMYQNEIKKYLP